MAVCLKPLARYQQIAMAQFSLPLTGVTDTGIPAMWQMDENQLFQETQTWSWESWAKKRVFNRWAYVVLEKKVDAADTHDRPQQGHSNDQVQKCVGDESSDSEGGCPPLVSESGDDQEKSSNHSVTVESVPDEL